MAISKICVHTCFSPADFQLCSCFPIKSSTAFPGWVCCQNTGVVKTIANSEPKWERKRHQHYHWTSGFGQVYYHWPSVPQMWWNQQTDNGKFKMESVEMEKGVLRYGCVLDKLKCKHACGITWTFSWEMSPANVWLSSMFQNTDFIKNIITDAFKSDLLSGMSLLVLVDLKLGSLEMGSPVNMPFWLIGWVWNS